MPNNNPLDTTVQKTNQLLSKIEQHYGWEGRRHQSFAALRTVLHALRDRLTVEQAANFSAQLTPLVTGVFFEGWKPERVPVKMSAEEFVNRVQAEFQFSVEDGPEDLIKTVMRAVADSVNPDEIEKLRIGLPEDIALLI